MEIPQEKNPFQKVTRVYIVNPWFLLVIFALGYISLDFFSMAGEDFLLTHLGTKKISWKIYLLISAILFGILYLITRLKNIPLIYLEQL